jgi:hypothetical protein
VIRFPGTSNDTVCFVKTSDNTRKNHDDQRMRIVFNPTSTRRAASVVRSLCGMVIQRGTATHDERASHRTPIYASQGMSS